MYKFRALIDLKQHDYIDNQILKQLIDSFDFEKNKDNL